MKVYVVTRWVFGGGGDDDREVLGVFSSAEVANGIADWQEGDVSVGEFDLDPALTRSAEVNPPR